MSKELTSKVKRDLIAAFLEDLYRLQNELDDDLCMDKDGADSGYLTYEESHKAIKKYTLKFLNKTVDKWQRRKGKI